MQDSQDVNTTTKKINILTMLLSLLIVVLARGDLRLLLACAIVLTICHILHYLTTGYWIGQNRKRHPG
ncbi:MAG: hypothetical protein HQL73_00020 [Magnetococcales bacterium]|nr:hypothetical protein [Magnetococcales bacterium]